jgi:hydroxymethylbilane synthase
VLDIDRFLPAPGQGAIAITARGRDTRALEALNAISDGETWVTLTAERAFLAELEGSCRTPIAGLARIEAGRLRLRGEVLRPDGSERFDVAAEGVPADAEWLGRDAGRDLKGRLPEGVLVKGG